METKIQKWGNSQGLRLAQHLLEQAHVEVGDAVSVSVKADAIIIRKRKRKYPSLEELVKQIPPDYKPSEYGWGKPMGKEVW